MDLGQKRRGVDMGPTAMRIAGLDSRLADLGHRITDFGNVSGPDLSTARHGGEKIRYLDDILKMCNNIADQVSRCVSRKMFPLVIGGDQSVSIGTLGGLARYTTRRGIIWIDAHGDFNTHETTPSGNVHGMALSAILGYGHPRLANFRRIRPKALEENTVLVGCRSIDEGEAELIERSNIAVYTMKEVDKLGIANVMREAIEIAGRGVENVHLSLDIDVLDPREAPGTGTPVPGGLTYREAHLAMEMLFEAGIVTSAELVEVNPILDQSNRTAEIGVQLLESLMGKRILKPKDEGKGLRTKRKKTEGPSPVR
ncbi:MAG: arginase [Thermoplasmata archaeon]|uniref:Arginase n=1 Tax=Candidatus Sysuiplasma superficiale TaxID=2823368 RepID=A0A8J7YVP6_9ARCH|nr:arginase [Candidatus Sysuiplasma superficiale]MBX8645062.1 arginase [Candidatus Sysuiplasma superficiale]